MPAKLQITSAAKIKATHARVLLFGTEDTGKTMSLVTAPGRVLWGLTEEDRKISLTREKIEAVYPPPADDAILAWMKKADSKTPDAELKKILDANRDAVLKDMTGVTYDMQLVYIKDYEDLEGFIELLKSGQFDSAGLDSLSTLSKILLEHMKEKGGKGGKPLKHGMQAYGKSADALMDFVWDLHQLPMHFFHIVHGRNDRINIGTEEDPVMLDVARPVFEGKATLAKLPFYFNDIYRSKKAGKNDQGKDRYVFQTQKTDAHGYERCSAASILPEEVPHLGNLTKKILGQ